MVFRNDCLFIFERSNPSLELFEESTLTRKPAKNNFSNDGSFFENFKRITEAAAKRTLEERELEENAAKRARGETQDNLPDEENEDNAESGSEESDNGDDEDRPRKRPQPHLDQNRSALVRCLL